MSTPNTQRGYSLLEMMVSIALFSLVMLLATGAFLKFMALERVARYTNDVTNNLSFAVDSMARSMRTGTQYDCGAVDTTKNCWPTPGSQFSFRDDQGRLITYLLKGDGSIGRCTVSGCTTSNAVSLTDKRIKIESLHFFVRGVGPAASEQPITSINTQPQVLVSIRGTMQPSPDEPPIRFSIQTLSTQRLLELSP